MIYGHLDISSYEQLKLLQEAFELLKIVQCELEVEGAGYILDYREGRIVVKGVGEVDEPRFEEILCHSAKLMKRKAKNLSILLN